MVSLYSLSFVWHALIVPKPSKHPSFPPLSLSPAELTLTQNCSLPISYCGFSFFTDRSYLFQSSPHSANVASVQKVKPRHALQ